MSHLYLILEPTDENHAVTKRYVDPSSENDRNRRDMCAVFNGQDNEFDNFRLTILDSFTFERNSNTDNEVSNKKYVADELNKTTFLRFNQSLQIYSKVIVGNIVLGAIIYNVLRTKDATIIKTGNAGSFLLPFWRKECNDRIDSGNSSDLFEASKPNSPTRDTEASSLPPKGDSFMSIETRVKNYFQNLFVSFERNDITQISSFSF